jgi:esterase
MRKILPTNLERAPDGAWSWQISLPVLTAALLELERNPLGADDRYGGPVLFVAGGKSPYIDVRGHATIHGHFLRAEIVAVPDPGHNTNVL